MKKIFTLFLIFTCITANSQNKLLFSYDQAGNQIVRELCLNCQTSRMVKETSELKEEDLEKFFPEDVISYYPNPVREELYLKWELVNDNKVSGIEIYSITGQLVKSYKDLSNDNTKTIPFNSYPIGTYFIQLIYTNGDQKSIKIVKQQ